MTTKKEPAVEAQPGEAANDPVYQIDMNTPSAEVPEIEQVEENLKA